MAALWLPGEVELRARYALHAALWGGHPYAEHGGSMGAAGTERGSQQPTANIATTVAHQGLSLPVAASDTDDDSSAQAAAVRRLLTPEMLAEIESVLISGCTVFHLSADLHETAARFYACLTLNPHLREDGA